MQIIHILHIQKRVHVYHMKPIYPKELSKSSTR